MSRLAYLFCPAILGLLTGIGHGINSHYLDLPFSLTDQVLQSPIVKQSLVK